jgi:preprotein translocase SecE subunit
MPVIWSVLFADVNPFLADSLLLIADAAVAVGLIFLGRFLERRTPKPHGFRAGVFCVCVAVFLILWITHGVGTLLSEQDVGEFGIILTLALAGGLIFAALRTFLRPGFSSWLAALEEQGWFTASSYKANQGVRVRRGTMLAILILGACGIYTMISHKTFGTDVLGTGNNWELTIPFTEARSGDTLSQAYLPLMFQVHYTLPVVFFLVLIWVAWRVVNWPLFTDFLIATEAEMNKVSWTPRKRLVQDTIVVLVTVFLITAFLFAVDLMWVKILTHPWVNVLKVDVGAEQLKQQEKTQW